MVSQILGFVLQCFMYVTIYLLRNFYPLLEIELGFCSVLFLCNYYYCYVFFAFLFFALL